MFVAGMKVASSGALKKVVQIFRNTTKQWTQVEIESEEGIQTITCTPGHKFYLTENKQKRDIGKRQEHESYYQLSEKWVQAIDLKTKDKVLLENGKYGIIKRVTLQQLETLENTYNFEVEDYHTYYVGNDGILTHNTGNCGFDNVRTMNNKTIGKIKNVSIDLEHTGIEANIHMHVGKDKFYYNGIKYVGAADILNNSAQVIKATEKALYYAKGLNWSLKL